MMFYIIFSGALLGFTDTDSFLYLLPSPTDIYEKLHELDVNGRWMDWSNLPENHPLRSTQNRLIPGKFKEEGGSSPFIEGVFLRSKMYSLINVADTLNKTTAKGISRGVKDRELKHSNYKNALDFPTEKSVLSIPAIRQKDHNMFTVTEKKSGLSSFNDKIWMDRTENGIIAHSIGYSPL